jgi:uncharacterized membrane protein YkvA (DUF1232 family)
LLRLVWRAVRGKRLREALVENRVRWLLDQFQSKASESDVDRIRGKLSGMNRGAIAKIWNDVLSLWGTATDPNSAWASRAIAIGALVYLISPLDAVPDVLPAIGLTDDATVILATVAMLCYRLAKARKRLSAE